VVFIGASATHDDSHPSVLAFLARDIDAARENLEPVQEKFGAWAARLLGVGVGAGAPMRLCVVLAERHATAVAPRAGQLVRLATEVRGHDTAAAAGAAGRRSGRLGRYLGHGARA
jgi:hypothetical protein